MRLSVVYITNRFEPRVEWMLDSLLPQFRPGETPQIIIVAAQNTRLGPIPGITIVAPKPTIWSGPHRITKDEWWSAASQRNTGICIAKHPWIAFLDDRSVLLPGWLDCVRQAMEHEYVVCGTYEKVHNLVVENGAVKSFTKIPGKDSRLDYTEKYWMRHGRPPFKCPGEWTYGCSLAMPLEWVLRVGGFDETCDGLGFEDSPFGLMLQNHGFPIYFDPCMRIFEDRTPGQCEPNVLKKDKGVSPADKSHALLAKLKDRKHTLLPPDLRAIRALVQAGKGFPAPTSPTLDWYDNEPIAQMT